jgi:hypothetical protein
LSFIDRGDVERCGYSLGAVFSLPHIAVTCDQFGFVKFFSQAVIDDWPFSGIGVPPFSAQVCNILFRFFFFSFKNGKLYLYSIVIHNPRRVPRP